MRKNPAMVQLPAGDELAGATVGALAPHARTQLGIAVRRGAKSAPTRASRSSAGDPRRSPDAKRSVPAHPVPQSSRRTPQPGIPEHERPRRGCRSAIDEAKHQERQRLAGLLEDHLQQLLISARLGIVQAQRRARAGGGAPEGLVGETLSRVEDLLQQSLFATRDLVADLNTLATEGPDLINSLRWLAGAVEERYGRSVMLSTTLPVLPVSEGLRRVLFGSVREALFTAVKHGGDSRVTVEVSMQDDQLQIDVSDHDIGCDVAGSLPSGAEPPGSEPGAIQGQLRRVNGSASIESNPGAGTRITIRAPLA